MRERFRVDVNGDMQLLDDCRDKLSHSNTAPALGLDLVVLIEVGREVVGVARGLDVEGGWVDQRSAVELISE